MMAFPKTTKKARSLKSLDAALWRWFSRYIRLRDADENGICRCVTCGRPHYWKDIDAGHFITRNHSGTKYDERNVNAQCKYCNCHCKGEQYKHQVAIDKKCGAGTAQTLSDLGGVRVKLDRLWYESMIEHYKAMANELMKKKGQ